MDDVWFVFGDVTIALGDWLFIVQCLQDRSSDTSNEVLPTGWEKHTGVLCFTLHLIFK